MEFDFLKNFPRRMKNVGAYALLFRNSLQKQTWKQYGFGNLYEQTNLIVPVLMFIMVLGIISDWSNLYLVFAQWMIKGKEVAHNFNQL